MNEKSHESPSVDACPIPGAADLACSIRHHIVSTLGQDWKLVSGFDCYRAAALSVRDMLVERWIRTQRSFYATDAKRVYYLSLEFLIGRSLGNALTNLGLVEECDASLHEFGYSLEDLREKEWDAGLGNGGLGRLAACFLDSMATLKLPAYGYGIRYEYGIFHQRIRDGYQVETPDNWLRYGNPWEFDRPEHIYNVRFNGNVHEWVDAHGRLRHHWRDSEEVIAMATDMLIPAYGHDKVINLRLWVAKSSRDFDLRFFNEGDYIRAVENKDRTETISKVLYPSDHTSEGRELRLKQQYFFVAASMQDIMRRYKKTRDALDEFPDQVAIQLNDTHPAIAIPELMRLLMDVEALDWDKAWDLCVRTFGYTNHTVLPEALEAWPVELIARVLPRHLQIIFEINRRFLKEVAHRYPGDQDRLRRMSLIEEGSVKKVRMAHLAIVGSHAVNGVAELHTQILKEQVFRDFHEFFPGKFSNKTNGVTPRRWLLKSNPGLSDLITRHIGDGWVTDLYQLKRLIPLAHDREFQKAWREVKRENKARLASFIEQKHGVEASPDAMFDVHVKRLHEYKRQLLNVLHVITLYNRLKANPGGDFVPRLVIFAGKAAPAYWMAKLIIKLIHSVGEIVNHDPIIGDRLKVVFLANYEVSLAERIIPGGDLSQQISTAGTEASGTGNMKLALNGALTIGTLDGANIEIKEEVGEENIFIFGLKAHEVTELRDAGYRPWEYYQRNPELKQALDQLRDGYFSPFQPDLFQPIVDSLGVSESCRGRDHFMVLADYEDYLRCQACVSATYRDRETWTRMSILNVANMGKFSTDRTIMEYARDIWGVEPLSGK